MFLFLDYYNLSLFLGGLVALLSGAAVYFNDYQKIENKAWMLLNISTAVWSFGYFGMITSSNGGNALVANWILHAGAILIPLFYLFFVTTLTQTTNNHRGTLVALIPVALYFLYQNTSTSFVAKVFAKGPFSFAPDAGPLYIYFTIYFFSVVIYAFTILAEKIKVAEKQEAVKLRYVLFSSFAGFVGGGFVFFLTFNISLPPYPLALFAFYPVIIAYAMLRHKLFDVKIAATEILTGSIWVALLFFTLLEENPEKQIAIGTIFILIVIFGVLLIQRLYKDVERREQVEKLASDLEESNKRQENLIHLISHEVKGGLGKANDVFAEIVEGSFDGDGTTLKEMARTVLADNRKVVGQVEDVLNSANFKTGKMSYDMKPFDFREALLESVGKYKPDAEAKGLAFAVHITESQNYTVQGDRALMVGHLFKNLLENAINFTPSGSIAVELTRAENVVRLSVKDTGVGITPEDMKRLFTEGGHGKDSIKVNVHSTGYGLFITKQIVDAHRGKIWAESPGAGKGASFFVELPTV